MVILWPLSLGIHPCSIHNTTDVAKTAQQKCAGLIYVITETYARIPSLNNIVAAFISSV